MFQKHAQLWLCAAPALSLELSGFDLVTATISATIPMTIRAHPNIPRDVNVTTSAPPTSNPMDRIKINSAVLVSNMPPTVQIIQICVEVYGLASRCMNVKCVLLARTQAFSFMEPHRFVRFMV